jgi:hypothetical protein
MQNATGDTVAPQPSRPQTPYQVLRLLPKDATPAQQDSAIQAWFQPGEIHYSEQPDTLHLPGHDVGRNLKDINIPQYYRENFFSKDTLYHPEINGGRLGMAGDPIPYAIRNDDTITALLLVSFVIALMAFAASRNYIARQLKTFFYPQKAGMDATETSGEFRAQVYFLLLTCLLLALFYFLYTQEFVASTFVLSDEYLLMVIFFGVFCGYYALKAFLYTGVNLVFFDSKKNEQWLRTTLFINGAIGVFLFPAVMLLTYFDVTSKTIIYYLLVVLVFVKILTFYKCSAIFFRQNILYLQIILYFCTLEIIPLIALWGGLEVIVNALKINF